MFKFITWSGWCKGPFHREVAVPLTYAGAVIDFHAEPTAEEGFEDGSVRRAAVSISVKQWWLWLCVLSTLSGCWRLV